MFDYSNYLMPFDYFYIEIAVKAFLYIVNVVNENWGYCNQTKEYNTKPVSFGLYYTIRSSEATAIAF